MIWRGLFRLIFLLGTIFSIWVILLALVYYLSSDISSTEDIVWVVML